MDKILTIDFDIIMWKSMELYNHMIINDEKIIRYIEKEMPIIQYFNPDFKLYKELTEYLFYLKNKNIPIFFVDSHEEVLNYINNESIVINIDHHHDLGYMQNGVMDKNIMCNNWAYLGLINNKIKNYIWLNSYTSTMDIPPIRDKKILNKISILPVLNTNLNKICKPSKVVICSSYPWIPTEVRNLLILWKNLLKGEKNE